MTPENNPQRPTQHLDYDPIKKMETDVGIADIISVGMKFINWLRPFDLDKSKEFLRLWDAFIKDSL